MIHDFEQLVYDFEMVVEYLQQKSEQGGDVSLSAREASTILIALRIADRLQKGDVSDGMYDAGDEMCMSFADRNEFTDAEEVFKAMSQQLFKECEDV